MVEQPGFSRFDIYLVRLDPTVGSEVRKTRPCAIVSPDELNHAIRTVIIAPLTTAQKTYPTRINCTFAGKAGQVALDQLRTADKSRLGKRLGALDPAAQQAVLNALARLFAP